MSFKTVIAQICLPGRNQSAGTVYELDEIEVCNPQGGDVAVKFLSQVIFIFLLFLGMVMYGNEVETKEK